MLLALLDGCHSQLRFLVATLGCPLCFRKCILESLQVRQHELGLNRVNVGNWIDLATDMDHVVIFEASNNLQDRVDLANMTQELIPQSLPFASSLNDARDVDQLEDRRHDFLRLNELRDSRKAIVRDIHDAFVGLDRAKGVVLGLSTLSTRERVK